VDKVLSNLEIKFVHVVKILIIVFSIGLLCTGIWLFTISKTDKVAVMFFPTILGGCWLFNIYKFNKELKSNENKITWFKIKYYLLMIFQSVFSSLVYLMIMNRNIWQTVHMFFWVVFCVATRRLMCYIKNKTKF
jgi:hypothetical protein